MSDNQTFWDGRVSLVCVDTYENGVPQGRIYHPQKTEGDTFGSLTELLIKMEERLEAEQILQSFTAARRFAPSKGHWPERIPNTEQHTGTQATFKIQILFRQNASWQGSITWLEGYDEQSFRSVLELIFLMNSVLAGPNQRERAG